MTKTQAFPRERREATPGEQVMTKTPPRYQVYLVDYSRYQVMDTRPFGRQGEPVPASRSYATEGWAKRRAQQLNG